MRAIQVIAECIEKISPSNYRIYTVSKLFVLNDRVENINSWLDKLHLTKDPIIVPVEIEDNLFSGSSPSDY